jgi:hypothetical protein
MTWIGVSPIFTVETGHPENPLMGVDANRSQAFPLSNRPAGLGRNSIRTPARTNVDFRLVKFFPFGGVRRLDLVAEAFNLLNHPNVIQVNNVFGGGATPQPGFLQPIAGASARQIQFSLDFEF